jgi:hypothetical protein
VIGCIGESAREEAMPAADVERALEPIGKLPHEPVVIVAIVAPLLARTHEHDRTSKL